MRTELRSTPVLALLAAGLAAACGHPSVGGSKRDGGCTAGTELCACLPGNVCTGNLVCGSNLCVNIASGSGGSGMNDDAAAGGGSGGTTGSGAGGSGGIPVTGANLITNGDFSQNDTFWKYILNGGNDNGHGVRNGMFCATVGNQSVTIGWDPAPGPALMLSAGTRYRFSFKASASAGVSTFTAKVGHAVDPFTTDFQQDDQVPNNLASFMHDFMPNNGDDNQTGIAFIIQGPGNGTSDVCIDDVSLTAN